MACFSLHCADNDSHMCGSADRLFNSIDDIPVCTVCGYKTGIYFVNPSFKVKRRIYDLSSTYDGYDIASLKFVEACRRLNIEGCEFLRLPSDPHFFVLKPISLVSFDSQARKTRFKDYCEQCGFYYIVAGTTPAFLIQEPKSDIAGTDVIFGSGNSRGRLLIVSQRAKDLLQKEKLRGLYFGPQCRIQKSEL